MSALTDDQLQFKQTEEWNLPTTPLEFLEWLRQSGVPGANDDERLAYFFRNNRAAAFMPKALKDALRPG